MDFRLSEEQEAIRQMALDFARDELAPHAIDWDQQKHFPVDTLRGAAARPPYMHAGQIGSLEAVIDHYARAPKAPVGASELHPLALSEGERRQLIAFLRTLSE